MKTIEKDGHLLPYVLEKKKIKHTYIRLKKDHVHVTTSKLVNESRIIDLLFKKFDILYKRLNNRIKLDDQHIRLWQKNYELSILKGKFSYKIEGQNVICTSHLDDVDKIRKLIYKEELIHMIKEIRPKVLSTLNKVGIHELPYKYKYLKSKFGSYHKKHQEITLNTFLATIDPIFLEYVLYHEYAHHKVFNHSKAFYQVLDNMMLNHKNIQKTLKKMEIL